jgi:hypothetical protein
MIRGLAIVVGTVFISANLAGQDKQIGDFHVVMDTDALDDTHRSSVLTIALETSVTRSAAMGWKCMADGLNVIIVFDTYFGGDSDDDIFVRYRIDQSPASSTQYWRLLQGNESAYMPMKQVSSFTAAAKQGRKLVVRVTDPLDGETYEDEFSLNGLAAALSVIEPC